MPPSEPANPGPAAEPVVPQNFQKGAKLAWHQKRRRRAVLSLMRGLSGRVLDYGCGYGDLTAAFAQTNDAIGCDVDPARVAFAQREYAPVEFVTCDAEGAPFADQSFDIVVSTVVIHFVPDPAGYLKEIRRLLRPNGHLMIVCKNEPVVRNGLRKLLGQGRAPSRLWVPPRAEMKDFITRAGFEILDTTYFYDPPLEGWKNLGDWVFGSVEQALSIAGIKGTAGYHAYLTRLTNR